MNKENDMKNIMKIDNEGKEMYERVKDGIMIWKIINN